jgi:hypothetical protein
MDPCRRDRVFGSPLESHIRTKSAEPQKDTAEPFRVVSIILETT